ncbi:MAG: VOC family protein [Janthinobacterium lividum]
MAINPKTKGLAHVALRTTDFGRAKAFYHDLLGLPIALDTPEILGFLVGSTFIGFKKAEPTYPGGGTFTPFNVGLDHIAIACEDMAELERVAAALEAAGVENTGIKQDTVGPMKYVAFKDPDRISWEFYMVQAS